MSCTAAAQIAREWAIPFGKLMLMQDGSIRAVVRRSSESRDGGASAFHDLTALKQIPFLPSSGFQLSSDGVVISWAAPGGQITPLPSLVAQWRKNPAIHIVCALDLLQNISRALSELDHLRTRRFLLSPAQAFLCEDTNEGRRWGLVALPVEGAGYAQFGESAPEVSAWISGDEFLQASVTDRAYRLGAALYYCLIGELFPEKLSRRERLRRLLCYRAGNANYAKSVLSAALPQTFAEFAARMADLISTVLAPNYGRPISAARAATELDRLQEAISAPALAKAWEAEGNIHFAVEILNVFARRAPAAEVPWSDLARLRSLVADHEGASEARRRATSKSEQMPAAFLDQVRAAVRRGADGLGDLEQAVSRLNGSVRSGRAALSGGEQAAIGAKGAEPLSDQEFLYLVYVNGRWLGRTQQSLRHLERDFAVSWDKIMSKLLLARMSADGNLWGDVLRACRECRRMIEMLPDKGSELGSYTRAYVEILDAIAHVQAVEAGMSDSYLEDALMKLGAAWEELRKFSPDDLELVVEAWLAVLARMAARKTCLYRLKLGIEAFCQSIGFEPRRVADDAAPAVPWFSEDRIFPT